MPNMHSGHRQRLKDRFFQEGLDHFPPHNALELLLFLSIPRDDTNPIAHRLLQRFGSISNVFEAPREELLKVEGVGPQTAFMISLIAHMTRYYLTDKYSVGTILDTPEKIGEFLKAMFIGKNNEHVYLLCLDKKSKLLHCELLMEGTLDSAQVTIRRIVETVMRVSASSVVLAHNHTQGFAVPSKADVQTTVAVKKALALLSIELLDHIIVARDDYVSLAQSGALVEC